MASEQAFAKSFFSRRAHLPEAFTAASTDNVDGVRSVSAKLHKLSGTNFDGKPIFPASFLSSFEISVKALKGGRTETLTVTNVTSLDSLRSMIKDKFDGVDQDAQRLVYQGKALPASGRYLFDFSITPGSVITLLVKANAAGTPATSTTTGEPSAAIDLSNIDEAASSITSQPPAKKANSVESNKYYKSAIGNTDFWTDLKTVIARHYGDDEDDVAAIYETFVKSYNTLCGPLAAEHRAKLQSVQKN